MPKIIGAVICGSLALIALVVSICSFKNIGFPLNNAYIFASKQEREQMDKRPLYRQTAVVSVSIAVIYIILILEILLELKWLLIAVGAFSVAAIVYAVKTSVR